MRALATLNKYFWRYRGRLLAGFFFVVISNFFAVIPAQVVRHALDLVMENVNIYRLSQGFQLQDEFWKNFTKILLLFAGIVTLFALLKGIFMFFMRQTIIVVSRLIEYDLKNDIYDHFQDLSLAFYRRNNTGDLMARITEDVSRVRMYLGPAIMYTINLTTLIILVVTIMVSVNPMLSLYVLAPFPILALSVYYVSTLIHKRSTAIQEQLSRLTTFVQEVFSGIRVIKAFASEKSVEKHFEEEVGDYRSKALDLVRVDALFFPLMLLLIGSSTLLTLYVGGYQVMRGEITVGNIAEFFIYVNILSWPVASIGWVTSLVQRAAASQARINDLLHSEPEIAPDAGEKLIVKGRIEFRNVSFVYPDTGIEALSDVNFLVKEGSSLGIIGRTGSGKSTIANLLLRLYDPTGGAIYLDEENLQQLHPGFIRKQIGYVPQDDFLFSETIKANIYFGYHPDVQPVKVADKAETHKMLHQVTTAADVFKDISEFPDEFETQLGERGITLSGGQKQRVSIARAIIGEPQIMVFDDSFSAIDTHTEAQILRNLSGIMQGKTTILISHRVSTVKSAEHILVLDKGKVVEQGSHNQLIQKGGYYSSLYRKQLIERDLYDEDPSIK